MWDERAAGRGGCVRGRALFWLSENAHETDVYHRPSETAEVNSGSECSLVAFVVALVVAIWAAACRACAARKTQIRDTTGRYEAAEAAEADIPQILISASLLAPVAITAQMTPPPQHRDSPKLATMACSTP